MLEELVGRGGQGEVWSARTRRGERVALKLFLHRSPAMVFRAWRAASLHRAVGAPSVVRVLGSLVHEGVPVLISEWIDGPSLADLLRRETLTDRQVERVARALFAAVASNQALRLVHPALTPSRVLLDPSPEGTVVKIADAAVGTHDGPGRPDLVGDVFAVGALLYQLVTGRRPYRGHTPALVRAHRAAGRFEPVTDHRPEAPDRWVAAIAWALEPDPAARAPSIARLREAWRGRRDPPERRTGRTDPPPTHEVQAAALLGRDTALARLQELMRDHPLITVRGPAGIGKSHLTSAAVHAASGQAPRIAELTDARDDPAVLLAIAQALQAPPRRADPAGHRARCPRETARRSPGARRRRPGPRAGALAARAAVRP